MVKLMDMKLYGALTVKEILHDGDTAKLRDIEKDVIGKNIFKYLHQRFCDQILRSVKERTIHDTKSQI